MAGIVKKENSDIELLYWILLNKLLKELFFFLPLNRAVHVHSFLWAATHFLTIPWVRGHLNGEYSICCYECYWNVYLSVSPPLILSLWCMRMIIHQFTDCVGFLLPWNGMSWGCPWRRWPQDVEGTYNLANHSPFLVSWSVLLFCIAPTFHSLYFL